MIAAYFWHLCLDMRSLLVLLLLLPPVLSAAQTDTATAALGADAPITTAGGDVRLTTTPRIDELLKAYGAHEHVRRGYRVQIFLGDRATAEATKRAFLQKNPDVPAYLSWLAPNFRLRVGDLRTRLEAERLLRDLKVAYPGSYIVPDDIGMPPLPSVR